MDARLIDHTLLKPEATPEGIAKLCVEAREYGFATVCVAPTEVARCAELLKGSSVGVCTVIGFPTGRHLPEIKLAEAKCAVRDGATELDFVVNQARLHEAIHGGETSRTAWIRAWKGLLDDVRASASHRLTTKLIIECCYLTDEEKRVAVELTIAAGFDFVKTSTGFGPGGATLADIELMVSAAAGRIGVKAAGGIRTKDFAEALVAAGATRIGASAGLQLL